jgi:hypothetical protein
VFIRWGTYYVDGIRCMNFRRNMDLFEALSGAAGIDRGLPFAEQPDYRPPEDDAWIKGAGGEVLFYLDVFERHVSAAEDDSLREVALLGPDTASRAVVVWQVRTMLAKGFLEELRRLDGKTLPPTFDAPYVALNLLLRSNVRMCAKAAESEATDACTVAPDARYRGTENRLFRVEIHDSDPSAQVTFKWSADNGSIVYPVRRIEGATVHLDSLGRDDRTALRVNDWVEVVDDRVVLAGQANPLLQVADIRPHDLTVTLSGEPKKGAGSGPHPILRRWASPLLAVREGTGATDAWIPLADGVEVQFSRAAVPLAGYRTGDYWLVPTRTAIGDVLWPKRGGVPRPVPPHGVEHHYAPLTLAAPGPQRRITQTYRRQFNSLGVGQPVIDHANPGGPKTE